jgi:transposase
MKDTKYLSFHPQFHYTDSHIKVHAFFCVLALILRGVLQLEMERLGHKMSIQKKLDTLSKTKQVITVFPKDAKTHITKTSFSGLEGIAKEYIDRYDLVRHAIKL